MKKAEGKKGEGMKTGQGNDKVEEMRKGEGMRGQQHEIVNLSGSVSIIDL